jgi:hypothetical protein
MRKYLNQGTAFYLTFMLALMFAIVTRWHYLGDFLIEDDTIFLPKALLGFNTYPGWNIYRLIDGVSVFNSISMLKFIPLVSFALNAVLITMNLKVYVRSINNTLAMLAGLAIGTIPISADQIIFVTASHPTLSLSFMLLALLMFGLALRSPKGLFLLYATISALAMLNAASFSPVGRLAPVTFLVWVVVGWIIFRVQCDGIPQARWILGLVVGGFSAVIYFTTMYNEYHYTGLKNWVEFSTGRIIINLGNAFDSVGSIYGPWYSLSFFIIIFISVSILAVFALVSIRSDKKQKSDAITHEDKAIMLIFMLSSLTLSASSFAPGSITTALLNRYLVAPFTLFLLSIVAFFFYLSIYQFNSRQKIVLGVLLLSLFFLNGVLSYAHINNTYKFHFATHGAVKRLVENDSALWPSNAQVVVLLTQHGYSAPTSGYNHWSTWYLRYLTGNAEIIGLLGRANWVGVYPFVEQYRDHDQEYWDHSGLRSKRIKMKGIEKERPLFVYEQNESGDFSAVDQVIFDSPNGLVAVVFGNTYGIREGKNFGKISCDSEPSNIYVWPGSQRGGGLDASTGGSTFHMDRIGHEVNFTFSRKFDGTTHIQQNFDLSVGTPFQLEIKIINATKHRDEHNPPMPILTPAVAFYQSEKGILIADRLRSQSWEVIPGESDLVEVVFHGVEGCYVLLSDSRRLLGGIKKSSINGAWDFGRGFFQRYWQGQIDVKLSTYKDI